jgi:GNAT superfamily N-acetyltransferase
MLANFFPPRGASIVYAGHAAAEGHAYDVYREMYGALADEFVRVGLFEHSVNLAAGDRELIDCFNSLGFGRTQCCAVRNVDPIEEARPVEIHQASAEDYAEVERLAEELTLHHTRSPIFNPYLRESDEASHGFIKGLLQDPQANAHWLAYDNGRAIGMNTFMQPFFLSPMTVPEKTIYLFLGIVTQDARKVGTGSSILSRGVQWARDEHYQHIALHFATANIPGARFWQSQGFKPVEFGMRRRIDERIAWASK